MKVRWQFYFEYEDLKFEKAQNYTMTISKEHAEAFGLPGHDFEAAVTIEAREEKHDSIKQLGEIHIVLPGYGEQTEDLAYSLVNSLAQHISFSQRRIKINGGFISNELLPETHEEEQQVGENRFSMRLQLRKVPDRVPFDSGSIQKVTNNPLMQQFNDANNAHSPVDRFIGLFKILEDLYGGYPLKAAFKNSTEFREIGLQHLKMEKNGVTEGISRAGFVDLIDNLVGTRHECAHLRTSSGFGITYGDSRVESDVIPLLGALEVLAYEAIRKSIGLT
jgi:hypothetical protein